MNVLAAIRLFIDRLESHVVKILCDNAASVSVIATGKGNCPVLLACARAIWEITAQREVVVQIAHIEGSRNCLADDLSRAHLADSRLKAINDQANKVGATFINVDLSVYKYESDI